MVLDLRDDTGSRFAVHLAGFGETAYWAGPPGTAPVYELTYTSATQPDPQPLCTAGANAAILFAGDRYDAARETVTATGAATRGWVNVACDGTALAKLHLTRHTEASQVVPTTAAEDPTDRLEGPEAMTLALVTLGKRREAREVLDTLRSLAEEIGTGSVRATARLTGGAVAAAQGVHAGAHPHPPRPALAGGGRRLRCAPSTDLS
jgi:hypothetical protein